MGNTRGHESKSKLYHTSPEQWKIFLEAWHETKSKFQPSYGLHCENMVIHNWITIVKHL